MTQSKTIIIIANKFELPAALAYPNATLIPADITSILACQKQKLDFTPLFKFFKSPSKQSKLYRLPFKFTRKFLSQPKVKSQLQLDDLDLTLPLTEMLRFDLVYSLEKYYLLHQLHHQLQFTKLVTSTSLFSSEILQTFSRHYQIHWQQPDISSSLNHKWYNFLKLLKNYSILLRQPNLLLSKFNHPSLSPASVLVFSNGLNLASYHSAIKSLQSSVSVNLFTGAQSPLDSFFLHQYQLTTRQINFSHPSITHRYQALLKQLVQLKTNFRPTLPSTLLRLPIKTSIINQLLSHDLSRAIDHRLNNFLRYYAAAEYLVSTTQPQLVITTHDPGPSGIAFTLAAQKHHLPTAILVHGSPSEIHFFFADKQVIWGSRMKQLLIKHGTNPNRLLLGGHPIYYDYLQYFKTRQPSTNKPLTLGILASGFGHNEINQVKFFIRLFSELAKVKTIKKIIIRTHATQQLDGIKQLAKTYRLNITLNPRLLLEEFVSKCDLIITQDSSAALVPLLAHKPTIALPSWTPFTDRGFVLNSRAFFRLQKDQTLSQLINHLLQDKALIAQNRRRQNNFLKQYCGPIDAKIGDRIAKKLLKLIR